MDMIVLLNGFRSVALSYIIRKVQKNPGSRSLI